MKSGAVFSPTLWAFELKLSDWKRALFQTVQAKSYAHYAMAIFPIEHVEHIRSIVGRFSQMRVGVGVFDMKTRQLQIIAKPQKESPWSPSDYWMACMGLSEQD
jgi:hypothetical protein